MELLEGAAGELLEELATTAGPVGACGACSRGALDGFSACVDAVVAVAAAFASAGLSGTFCLRAFDGRAFCMALNYRPSYKFPVQRS